VIEHIEIEGFKSLEKVSLDLGPLNIFMGGGREELMQQTLSNLRGLLERCPELAILQVRICDALA
jgi:predicted ATPase